MPAPTPHQAQPPPDPTRGEQSPPEGSRALLPDSPCAELQPLLSETYLGFRPLIPASRLLLITLPCRSREQVNEGKGVYFPIRLLSWLSCIFTHNRNHEKRRKTGAFSGRNTEETWPIPFPPGWPLSSSVFPLLLRRQLLGIYTQGALTSQLQLTQSCFSYQRPLLKHSICTLCFEAKFARILNRDLMPFTASVELESAYNSEAFRLRLAPNNW